MKFSERQKRSKFFPNLEVLRFAAGSFARQTKQPISYTWYMFDACQGGIGWVPELVIAVPFNK
jgi:hypothetical protein